MSVSCFSLYVRGEREREMANECGRARERKREWENERGRVRERASVRAWKREREGICVCRSE